MVGQHHSARSEPDRRRARPDRREQHRRRSGGDARHAVVLGHPEPGVAQPLGPDRALHGVRQRDPFRVACAGAGTVEQREPHALPNRRRPGRLPDRRGETSRPPRWRGQPIRRRTTVIGWCTHHRTTRRPRCQRSAHSGGRAASGRDDGGAGWTATGCPDMSASAGDSRRPLRKEANDGIDGANGDSSSSDVSITTPTDASRWDPSPSVRGGHPRSRRPPRLALRLPGCSTRRFRFTAEHDQRPLRWAGVADSVNPLQVGAEQPRRVCGRSRRAGGRSWPASAC